MSAESTPTFTEDTSKKTVRSPRSIYEDIKIATDILSEVKMEVVTNHHI